MFKFKRLRSAVSTRTGLPQIKQSYGNVLSVAKEIIQMGRKPEDVVPETFDAAVQRLGLNKEELQSKKAVFFRNAIIYLVLAAGLFIYWLVLIASGTFLGIFINTILVIMMLGLAFREHFWYTQIKYQKLGMSIRQWIAYTFSKGGAS